MTVARAATSPTRLGLGLASLVLAAFLLIGFKSPQDVAVAGTSGTSGTTGSSGSGGSSGTTRASGSNGTSGSTGAGSGTSGSTAGSSSGSTSGASTVDGTLIDTRYGPVQVEITVANRKVTGVSAVELPSGGRSGAISAYAAPLLSSEALTAQSAKIDIVSGATYTSEGYAQSLQAALDQAGL